ncbi:YbhB/YbcL family Raf kinase inhibitor-like protein [Eggerthellaceae bacterium zg-887]|uniref:YbhB/YbcL family Raf kinase inhibitor-like protein n=1 Tax=Xiamenia xianingshaonis TaxID=2682776 RepID=UPI0014082E82|nr:YbhB/YbcL family Raf kinase inhibitor-like protein [Xiamenia xianingshaonis]NHM16065.1 YbhB/YbcL family Raf kinase inhibitor-like protein [Xiamenia xianingshaonis]
MLELQVTSSQFENEGWMPDSLAGYGEDRSPELFVNNIPEGTATLAIVMDDLDHPLEKGFNHWVAWNVTPSTRIPGSMPKGATLEAPIHIEQGIGYGKHGYRGPKPPFNWNHRYRFTVYALDAKLDISTDSKKETLMEAIESHVLASGMLTGKYQRRHA